MIDDKKDLQGAGFEPVAEKKKPDDGKIKISQRKVLLGIVGIEAILLVMVFVMLVLWQDEKAVMLGEKASYLSCNLPDFSGVGG